MVDFRSERSRSCRNKRPTCSGIRTSARRFGSRTCSSASYPGEPGPMSCTRCHHGLGPRHEKRQRASRGVGTRRLWSKAGQQRRRPAYSWCAFPMASPSIVLVYGGMRRVDLYHGTSSFFAKKLLLGSEASPLKSSGAFACVSELYQLMITTAGSFIETAKLYPKDRGVGGVAPLALKNVHERYDASLMAYGAFFASFNRRIAGSYAANNPSGSELLRFLNATISALRCHGVTGLDEMLDRYPDLSTCRVSPSCCS